MKPTRTDAVEDALAKELHERLSVRDVRLLQDCWSRQDVDVCITVGKLTVHQLVWLLHYKLLATRVDKADCVWIETTQLGRDLVRHMLRAKTAGKEAVAI